MAKSNALNKRGDLTQGPIFRSMTLFALPMLLGNMLQQLYNIVDTWVVGRWIGTDALAAVGVVFALMVFLTSVLLGLCMGSGAVFSHCFGKKDYETLERRIGTAFLGIAGVAALITLAAYVCCDWLLVWMNIPAELRGMTRLYMRIIFAGIPAVFLYNFFAGYLKSIGNSFIPLLFLVLSSVTNIVLDVLFVVALGMGISGAAAATIFSQYLSGVLTAVYCIRKDAHIKKAFSAIDIQREDIRVLGSYSLYTCLQQSVMNLGILMVQGIVNSFGTQIMAAFTAGVKIDAFAYMPAQEYGNAFSTFLAQNDGAGKTDRVKKGTKIGVLTTAVYCSAASVVICAFAENLMRIFIDDSEKAIIAAGVGYLRIEGAFYAGIGVLFLWYGFYRALGKPQMSLVLTIISLGTRVLLANLAASTAIGVTGIWWAVPIGWFLADAAGLLYYLLVFQKQRKERNG